MTGNIVNDCPQFLSPEQKLSHSIQTEVVEIPLELNGVISSFNIRTPTNEDKANCQWINMTDISEWDPHSEVMHDEETRLLNYEDGPALVPREIY